MPPAWCKASGWSRSRRRAPCSPSPSDYALSSTEYGGMFVPQAIMAIVASLAGAGLRNRLGTKRIYLLGLFANLLAMTLLVVSRFVMSRTFAGLRNFAGGHDLHGHWLRLHRAGAQHVCRGVFSAKGGSSRAGTKRAAGSGHGARAGFYRAVRGPGNLVGTAGAGRRAAARTAVVQLQSTIERRRNRLPSKRRK